MSIGEKEKGDLGELPRTGRQSRRRTPGLHCHPAVANRMPAAIAPGSPRLQGKTCTYTDIYLHTLRLTPKSPQACLCQPQNQKTCVHFPLSAAKDSRCEPAKRNASRLAYLFFKRLRINLSFCKIRNISLFVSKRQS